MIEKVLKKYHIVATDIIPMTDNVYKISDGTRYYSLKKSTMSVSSLNNWLAFYKKSNNKNLKGVLPIYYTNSNSLYVSEDNFIFYLSPWVDGPGKPLDVATAFELISHIHSQTTDNYGIDNEKLIVQFEEYEKKIEAYPSLLLEAMEKFERKNYMTPFELLICTEFKEVEKIIDLLKQTNRKFIDSRKDKTSWKVGLCHGQLVSRHFINSDRLFIINWEKARYGHCFQDLYTLIDDLISEQGVNPHLLIQSLSTYLNINELEWEELYLLIIYILDCQDYLEKISYYLTNQHKTDSLIKQIIAIQKIYRRLQFGVILAEYVEDRKLGLEKTDD